ncbi:MAG TPA: ABC transporter permease, partial [Vicinamibacterales bacterium]|nr:ABC transporter permease [Vicinamibacterales bacterium]
MAVVVERQRIPWSVALRKEFINYQRLTQFGFVVALLAIWEIAGRRLGDFFLAPPSSLVSATQDLIASGELVRALLDSLVSLATGYGLSALIGITLGYLMGWYKPVAKIMDPFVNAAYVIPVAALVPVVIIWFGLGFTSRVLVILLFSVFEVLVSTYTGVRNVDPMLIDVARSFGARQFGLFRKIVFFASLPYIFAGLRMGASRAIKGMVVAELLFAVTGLGGAIQTAANYYRTDQVFVYVIVIALLGIVLAGAIQILE